MLRAASDGGGYMQRILQGATGDTERSGAEAVVAGRRVCGDFLGLRSAELSLGAVA